MGSKKNEGQHLDDVDGYLIKIQGQGNIESLWLYEGACLQLVPTRTLQEEIGGYVVEKMLRRDYPVAHLCVPFPFSFIYLASLYPQLQNENRDKFCRCIDLLCTIKAQTNLHFFRSLLYSALQRLSSIDD